MIVYTGTKSSFIADAQNNKIAGRVHSLFESLGITQESEAEFRSWERSLKVMALNISNRKIDDDVQVAIEYQIPLTSKRVDFMVGGSDGERDNVVIVELKQWEDCTPTRRENVVKAFTGGAERDVAHPSQQAYSYAKLIEHFNEDVRNENIGLIPCAFLHNFKEKNRKNLCHEKYLEAIKDAPVFLEEDGTKLSEFIANYVSKPSNKRLFDIIENGKLKPSKSLQDTVGSILNGNQEFEMIDEQQVAYATVLRLVEESIGKDDKYTIIVQGGPGTGKSVIAVNLLAKIINNGYTCVYTTKNGAPRYTFSNNLIKGKHKVSYLRGLFKGSGSFYNVPKNTYDCILSDESHRLRLKSGIYSNLGENQVKEIINAAKISVFFIDEDQKVTTKDIGSIDEIKKQAKALGAHVYHSKSLTLESQFRCNGSDGYIAFLDDLLGLKKTANWNMLGLDYDFRIFESATEMREALREKNGNNKSRMIAGYCYPWESRNDKRKMDIVLSDDFYAQWNFNTNEFATDPESFEQVGCIHSTQGLEFDYAGIIIGKDLIYKDGKVCTDQAAVSASDKSSGIRACKDKALADRLIRNTYKTLLSRGQKGCFVYCEDEALREYIKARIKVHRHTEL